VTAVVAAVSTTERLTALVAQLSGLAILAGTLALVAAFVYRWYVREPIPRGLAVLVGVSAVAAYLNTTTVLGEVIGGTSDATQTAEALFNIAAFGAGVVGASAGRRVGDGFGTDVFDVTTFAEVDDGVGRLVKAVGRVITVELPEDIEDVVGYDPVPEATKADLAGQRFVFPRTLTVDQLRDRLVARLKTDYAVGHVDVELDEDGTVTYFALGSRAAGIGPTLPPATNAMAIRADPAFAASAGDLVQVWETDPARRVLTAELRGTADDVVTVAIDAADTSKLDPDEAYRLVTLPVEDRPDREFASLLRAADETFASVTVAAESAIAGAAVGGLDVTVLSVAPADGDRVVLPTAAHVLAAGDVIHAIARPEALRRLETAATEPVGHLSDDDQPAAAEQRAPDVAVEDEVDVDVAPTEREEGDGHGGEADGPDSAADDADRPDDEGPTDEAGIGEAGVDGDADKHEGGDAAMEDISEGRPDGEETTEPDADDSAEEDDRRD
jgi:hypothetical protein